MSSDMAEPDADEFSDAALDERWQKLTAAVGLITTRSVMMDGSLSMAFWA